MSKNAPKVNASAKKAAAAPVKTVERKRIDVHRSEPAAQVNTVTSALPPDKIIVDDGKGEKLVMVNVPKPFKLMDDHRHIHHYDIIGKQAMPVSHANAPYAKANGVTLID